MRGDQLRVFHFVKGLAGRAEVTLLCFGHGPPLPFDGVRVETVAHGPLATVAANAGLPDPRLPLQVRLFLSSRMRRAVRRELALGSDVVHATLARMGPYLAGAEGSHRHVDLVDALSLNMATRAKASPPGPRQVLAAESRLMRRYEAELLSRADSGSLVSESDRAVGGLEAAAVIPNGVDRELFPFRDPSDRPPALLFFGNLGYFHNVEPARFVAEQVLPRVRTEVPEATLRIGGARPAAAVRRLARLDGVELAPDVPSMAEELHRAAVAVLPMFSGSGMKNKVLEAFCAGTPVVTNAAGIAGVTGAEAGRDHLLAEGADSLAGECVRLLRDAGERSRLAAAALALVERRFTWERQVDALMDLYGV
jgi:glycosyltransferase involved in cell wall biosynthesis